eukprot:CAMPEP_0202870932 /NCGR_PEP_ID=MMETSP1391-20130828/17230_1 /ASSEMBLY_ACC=CAM_ASM_000867 /TAXON_ID=1034604 /ORGANISM="Chlamydomonas leiostraca, Strain SAG 11-49" /LENGTH=694 /DNA_ID=CAMNT_0049551609 /DNA_START=229 /DNA_END=2313 /DNA_ORIENTATION=+
MPTLVRRRRQWQPKVKGPLHAQAAPSDQHASTDSPAWPTPSLPGDSQPADHKTASAQHEPPQPQSAPAAAAPVPSLWQEVSGLLKVSIPLAMSSVMSSTLHCASESLVGQLGAASLSSSTLAYSLFNMTGTAVVWGGAVPMESLVGQAHGAGNTRLVRVLLLRALCVCLVLCLPVWALWANAGLLLERLGQNPSVAAIASSYLRALSPSLLLFVGAECLHNWAVFQGEVRPAAIARTLCTAAGPAIYWLFMFKLEHGLMGAAYAYCGSQLLFASMLVGYIWWRDSKMSERATDVADAQLQASTAAAAEAEAGAEEQAGPSSRGYGNSSISKNGHHHHAPSALASEGSSTGGSSGGSMDGSEASAVLGRGSSSNSAGALPSQAPQPPGASSQQAAPAPLAAAQGSAPGRPPKETAQQAADRKQEQGFLGGIELLGLLKEAVNLKGCWEYVRFGIPSAAMVALEMWAHELNVLMAGTLPDAEVAVAVLGISALIANWIYTYPTSLAVAACARISHALGGGQPALAQRAVRVSTLLVLAQQLVLAAGLLALNSRVVSVFCSDAEVMAVACRLLPIVACNTVSDGVNCYVHYVLRACGRQSIGAWLQVVFFWVLGVPLAMYLGFHLKLGVAGFLGSIGCCSFAQAVIGLWVIARFDWEVEVRRAAEILDAMAASSAVGGGGSDSGGGGGAQPALAMAH